MILESHNTMPHTPHKYTQGKFQRYLPAVRTDFLYKLQAEDVMEKELYVVPLRIRYREVSACVRIGGGG